MATVAMRAQPGVTGAVSRNTPDLSGRHYYLNVNPSTGFFEIPEVDTRDIAQLMKLGFTVIQGAAGG